MVMMNSEQSGKESVCVRAGAVLLSGVEWIAAAAALLDCSGASECECV